MPDRVISAEADTRFQYDVIKNLADSVRQMATNMADLQKTQIDMLVRLARLEENKVGDELVAMKASTVALSIRVDALESDKDRRDGALGLLGAIKSWAPFLAMLFSAASVLWLYGRSAGFVPAPPVAPTKVEATIDHGERKIEGIVGGKP